MTGSKGSKKVRREADHSRRGGISYIRAQRPKATWSTWSKASNVAQSSRHKEELVRLLGQKLEGLICHSQESGFYPGGDRRALCKDVVGSFLYQKDHSTNSTEKELKERTREERGCCLE